jgi:hypothetical protein
MEEIFEGRNHPLKKWEIIRDEVLKYIESLTLVFVLVEFQKYCQHKNYNSIETSLYWIHGVFFYIHWLLYYYSFSDYEIKYEIPKTSANKLIIFFTYHV